MCAFFDYYAIRSDSEPPPLKQFFVLGGRLSSHLVLLTVVIVIYHVYCFREWNFVYGFGGYLMIHEVLALIGDGLLSNNFGKNIQNLRRMGYSDWTILSIMHCNLVASQLLGYMVMNCVTDDPTTFTWEHVQTNLTLAVMFKILVNLVVAEILFMAGHDLIHRHPTLMKLHVLHHCSTFASWNTNLLFHPVDLAIEFGGPFLGVLTLHYLVWNQDQLTMVLTYLIFQLWYAYDHDETMQLYHVSHHTHCDSLYGIYSKLAGDPSKNLLKKYMKDELSLVWPKISKSQKSER